VLHRTWSLAGDGRRDRGGGRLRDGAPALTPTLGVVGTLVWDRIVPAPEAEASPAATEAWGGIGYGIAAAAAALDGAWTVRPLVKVGRDLEREARAFLSTIPGVEPTGLRIVEEPNNRVELRYRDAAERTERLTGGVPPWTRDELVHAASPCDALLVNFISGHEADLEACRALRAGFDGPIYTDLHSLFLGVDLQGIRVPRPLAEFRGWTACFDAVQLNDEEAHLAAGDGAVEALIHGLVSGGLGLAAVTRGAAGAIWAACPSVAAGEGLRSRADDGDGGARVASGSVTIGTPRHGDPTGCGDVWGAAFFARLLLGNPVPDAAETATRLAARSVEHRGADDLYDVLHAEVVS
jgi:sugar/nucleoside kinase (ribokinase family)